jgi:hypothetical protein
MLPPSSDWIAEDGGSIDPWNVCILHNTTLCHHSQELDLKMSHIFSLFKLSNAFPKSTQTTYIFKINWITFCLICFSVNTKCNALWKQMCPYDSILLVSGVIFNESYVLYTGNQVLFFTILITVFNTFIITVLIRFLCSTSYLKSSNILSPVFLSCMFIIFSCRLSIPCVYFLSLFCLSSPPVFFSSLSNFLK